MADSSVPRPSTDEGVFRSVCNSNDAHSSAPETAPLLQSVSSPDDPRRRPEDASFSHKLAAAVHEPLSPLSKILLVLVLLFLLLSSVFIGLFAGAQHKLNKGYDNAPTVTSTATVTVTSPPSTATSIELTTTTAYTTTTDIATTTVAVPAPVPTTKPEEVRESLFSLVDQLTNS